MSSCNRSAVPFVAAVWLGLVATIAAAQQQDFSAVRIRSYPVQGSVHLLVGAGGNTTVQVGADGILIVDTQYAPVADRLFAKASELGDGGPLRYVINTHMHPDHVGGNARLRQLAPGTPLEPFSIIAHLNALTRLVQLEKSDPDQVPEGALPLASFDVDSRDFYFNGEAVYVLYEPRAHTDGDVIVHFRKSDVISTGDVFVPGGYPFIDIERGGSVQGIIAALNHILFLAVPAKTQERGTYIVPGHGRICDEADVVEYRDMVQIVTDRVQSMIDGGMSLRQIQRARPTLDYDGEHVNESSFVTAEAFVEAVYTSLVNEQ